MNTKNLIYQILIALGAVAVFFGLANLTGVVDYLLANLDTVWAAGATLVGIIIALWGVIKDNAEEVAAKDAGQVKSVVGQILIALGAIAAFAGLAKLTDVVNFLLTNLDTIWAVALTLIGFVAGLFGLKKV